MGSFVGASVWRLRARQLSKEGDVGSKADKEERKRLQPLLKTSLLKDYSRCLNCAYRLRWYDMIPIVSWIVLRGRCRKCRTRIGMTELLLEVGVASFFVLSYAFWPYLLESAAEIGRLVIWMVAGVGLTALFVYDLKWFLLPDRVNFAVIGLGIINILIIIAGSQNIVGEVINITTAVLILSGLYLMLNLVSKGSWVGFGDVKLGLGLALLLADWRLAFMAFFVANLVGTLVVTPALITGKLNRNSHVPLGPLLILGWMIAGLVGPYLIDAYLYYPI